MLKGRGRGWAGFWDLALFAHQFDVYPMKCCMQSIHFRNSQLGVHADRGNNTCLRHHFIFGITVSHCRLPQACLDLLDEFVSHRWQHQCS